MTILTNFPRESTNLKNHLDDNTKHLKPIEKEKINTMLTPADENTLFAVPGKNNYNIVKVIDNGETAEFFLQDNLNMGTDNIVRGVGATARGRQCVSVPGTFFNIVETNGNIITLDKSINNYSSTGEIILCSSIQTRGPKRLTILDVDKDGYNITVSPETNISIDYNYVVLIKPTANSAADTNHAEGSKAIACAITGAHAEGVQTLATGVASHAENQSTEATAHRTHAEGFYTKASSANQHVQGKYNIEDANGIYADIVGNGRNESNRSNAYTLDWEGNGWFSGNVTVGNENIELLKNDLSNVNQEEFATKVNKLLTNTTDNNTRPSKFVIGTMTAGYSENDCDYLISTGEDAYYAFCSAIDALGSNGGEIIVLNGFYYFNKSVPITKNVIIKGNGKNSTILLKNYYYTAETRQGLFMHADSSSQLNIEIKDLTLGTRQNNSSFRVDTASLLYFSAKDNILLENILFEAGTHIKDNLAIFSCNNLTIKNCIFTTKDTYNQQIQLLTFLVPPTDQEGVFIFQDNILQGKFMITIGSSDGNYSSSTKINKPIIFSNNLFEKLFSFDLFKIDNIIFHNNMLRAKMTSGISGFTLSLTDVYYSIFSNNKGFHCPIKLEKGNYNLIEGNTFVGSNFTDSSGNTDNKIINNIFISSVPK